MEWQQFEYFHTLAAGKLSLSQPALSRSIAKLEQELGIPLFDKQSRIWSDLLGFLEVTGY